MIRLQPSLVMFSLCALILSSCSSLSSNHIPVQPDMKGSPPAAHLWTSDESDIAIVGLLLNLARSVPSSCEEIGFNLFLSSANSGQKHCTPTGMYSRHGIYEVIIPTESPSQQQRSDATIVIERGKCVNYLSIYLQLPVTWKASGLPNADLHDGEEWSSFAEDLTMNSRIFLSGTMSEDGIFCVKKLSAIVFGRVP